MLRLDDANFENLLEATAAAVVVCDPAGVIRFVNRHAELLFGYHRDDLLGQRTEMLVPESRREVDTALRSGYFADPFFRPPGLGPERTARHRDGTEFPVDFSVSHIETEDGPLAIAAVRDLTGLKRPDKQAAGVECSDDATIDATIEGIITSWNPAAERLSGYTSEEMIGTSASRLIPPDLAGEMDQILAQVRSSHSPREVESVLVRKDGTLVPVAMTLAPILDADGTIVGVSSIAHDVAARRAADQGFHHLVVLLESANAAISGETDAIVGATLEGIITSWNPGAEAMFGYSSKEMIGESIQVLSPKNRLDEAAALAANAREGQAIESYESVGVRRDGTTFPVSLTISPSFDADGAVIGVYGIVRDLTAQRRDQREIAEWRAKAFKWMEDLEQSQRLSVMRDFERELKVIDLQQEVERLRRLAAQDPRDLGDEL